MSVHYDRARDRWVVRWREAGRQRARRFKSEAEARTLDAQVSPGRPEAVAVERPGGHAGVYAYETAEGARWRFVFRQSDGRLTSRRGFTSRSAALAARAIAVEGVRRGDVRATRDTFGEFGAKVLEAKRPFVTAGTLQDYTTHGRKRLLPWFGDLKLPAVGEDRVRDWLAEMAELLADGELSAKTVNNARTCLSMTLGEAVRRRHIPQNPWTRVPELPVERTEFDYLRMDEIDRYLDACADYYRPLAEFLIGTGARISEALAVRWPDADLDAGIVRIARQHARGGDGRHPRRASGSGPCRSVRGWPRRRGECAKSARVRLLRMAVGCSCALPHAVAATRCGGFGGRRAERHAAALAAPHGRDGVARDRPPADLRAAPARASLDHDDRGGLRPPGDVVHSRGGGADRGADRCGRATVGSRNDLITLGLGPITDLW
jgi:hypothetical protein